MGKLSILDKNIDEKCNSTVVGITPFALNIKKNEFLLKL